MPHRPLNSRAHPGTIGVIHLPPLVGAPGAAPGAPSNLLLEAGTRAIHEARALERAGFDALILENFGDVPFYRDAVPAETVACLSVIAAAVREAVSIPVGINVLRNDAKAALAIAAVTGCDFIRVNVLSGVAATDQGWIEGCAAELTRERARLGADVRIFADVHVKHARTFSSDDLALAVEEAALRAGADAVIVTGSTTGRAVDAGLLAEAAEAARACKVPVYVGSGATAESASELLAVADGLIVGSAIRAGGKAGAPLDPARIKAFLVAVKSASAIRSGTGAARTRSGVSSPGARKKKAAKKKASRPRKRTKSSRRAGSRAKK